MSLSAFVLPLLLLTADEPAPAAKTDSAAADIKPATDNIPRGSDGLPEIREGFGVWTSLNAFPLGVDFTIKQVHIYASWNPWASIFTAFRFNVFSAGAGYSFRLTKGPSERDMFFFDLTGILQTGVLTNIGLPGNAGIGTQAWFGAGFGAGIRYQRADGIYAGFRLPLFGAMIAPNVPDFGLSVASFFVITLLNGQLAYLGYRF